MAEEWIREDQNFLSND